MEPIQGRRLFKGRNYMKKYSRYLADSLQLIVSLALYQMCLVFSHQLLVKGADFVKKILKQYKIRVCVFILLTLLNKDTFYQPDIPCNKARGIGSKLIIAASHLSRWMPGRWMLPLPNSNYPS